MHQVDEKVTLDERLDKACEPGVDYGEGGGNACTWDRAWATVWVPVLVGERGVCVCTR